ncbi:MAG: chorismate mutase [Verrucomicrobiales bacterium]|nr:chorismate mutase [Verrucomicrobiales bacterium]
MKANGTDRTLDDLRVEIDAVDSRLLQLLNERADLVHEVGEIKKQKGLEIYAPEREEKLLQSLVKKSQGRLPEKSIRAIYREIMSAALALEENLKIAYLGPEGTWTHQAGRNKFGASVEYVAQASLADVFEKVASRQADYGVVPIGNSTDGGVSRTLDYFSESDLQICAQVNLLGDHDASSSAARFLVLAHNSCPPTGKDITALLIHGDADGLLSGAMKILADLDLKVTQIDGRQESDSEKLSCVFVEVQGHQTSANMVKAIDLLVATGKKVRVLGSYPATGAYS